MIAKQIIPGIITLMVTYAVLKPLPVAAQQLSGYIYLVLGNQMPAPGHPVGKGRGVSRNVYIYQPTTIAQTKGTSPLFSAIQTKPIAHTNSDSTGFYSIKLPPGKYSLFAADGNSFFAGENDGNGTLNPIEMGTKAIVTKDITVNVYASY